MTHWSPLLAKTPKRYSRRTFSLWARSPCPAKAMASGDAGSSSANGLWPVSYTHLTLPTICSV
eukprot:12697415-Alexandrium_andersonii.AAC.1